MNKVVCRYFMHGGEPPDMQLYFTELLDIISGLDAQKVTERMRTHINRAYVDTYKQYDDT